MHAHHSKLATCMSSAVSGVTSTEPAQLTGVNKDITAITQESPFCEQYVAM